MEFSKSSVGFCGFIRAEGASASVRVVLAEKKKSDGKPKGAARGLH